MKKSRYLLLALAFLGFQTAVQAQEKVITRGQEVSTNGNMPAVGAAARDFTGTDKEPRKTCHSEHLPQSGHPYLRHVGTPLQRGGFGTGQHRGALPLQGPAFCTGTFLHCRGN